MEIKIKEGDSEVTILTSQKLKETELIGTIEAKDIVKIEDFLFLKNRFDNLLKFVEAETNKFRSRIIALEKKVNGEGISLDKINAPMEETKAVEEAAKKLEEFNPEFYVKTSNNLKKSKKTIMSLEEIKQRIIEYAKEKDPKGLGFTFRYGANMDAAPAESRKEAAEISTKIYNDRCKVKQGLLQLIEEGKLERRLAKGKRNLFLYFLNNGKTTVKDIFDDEKKQAQPLEPKPDFTAEELLKN